MLSWEVVSYPAEMATESSTWAHGQKEPLRLRLKGGNGYLSPGIARSEPESNSGPLSLAFQVFQNT